MQTLTFGTDGWRDVIADRFTFANLRRAAQAYATYLRSAGGDDGVVLVGYDTRFLAREFAEAVAGVLAANGVKASLSQTYLPTPALSFAVKHWGARGGVMLTASHNPPRYGGFKLKGSYGGSATDEVYRAVARLVPQADVPEPRGASFDTFDIRDEYFRAVAALVDIDAIGRVHPVIVHDALGGAGSGWLTGLAEATGAFAVQAVRGRPDPLFHGVNPEPIPANLAVTSQAMRSLDARDTDSQDAGDRAGTRDHRPLFATVTDGDADRIGVVLPGGDYFNSHQIFAVLLDHLSTRRTGSVVKTFTVSRVVEQLARARGLEVVETPVGFKHIVDAMLAGGTGAAGVLIGGEESGGIGVAGHIPERDAIANTLLLLEAVVTDGRTLARRFADIEAETGWRHAYDRLDLHLSADGTKERVMARLAGGGVAVALAGWRVASVEDRDGVKLNLARESSAPDSEPNAWLLFRASGTEPVLRLYCEAPTTEDVAALLAAAEGFVAASQPRS
jgi:phosphomannomutase